MGAEHDAVEVDAHRAAVELELEVVPQPAAGRDPGVEVGEVEAAAALDREGDRIEVGLQVGDVGGDEVPADLLGDRAAAVGVEVADDHLGPSLSEGE